MLQVNEMDEERKNIQKDFIQYLFYHNYISSSQVKELNVVVEKHEHPHIKGN